MSKPTILTVDDDPQVSAAITRDLASRYGADYRVVRATSGPDALAVLARLALRDEPVALIAADQRMPEMTGIELLEQATGREAKLDMRPMQPGIGPGGLQAMLTADLPDPGLARVAQASRYQLGRSQVLLSQPVSSTTSLLLAEATPRRATTGITTRFSITRNAVGETSQAPDRRRS